MYCTLRQVLRVRRALGINHRVKSARREHRVDRSTTPTCKVTSDDSFTLDDLTLPDHHAPTGELIGISLDLGRQGSGDEVVGDDIPEEVEPERGERGQELSFVWYSLSFPHVKSAPGYSTPRAK